MRTTAAAPLVPAVTATTLIAIGAVHVAWGMGSSFPFRDRATLADAVVGNDEMPGRAASFAVAGLLGVAAALVADRGPLPATLRRIGAAGVAAVLATRAAFGFAGVTERLVPGSNSARFVDLDRRVLSPLCAALAAGALSSTRSSAVPIVSRRVAGGTRSRNGSLRP